MEEITVISEDIIQTAFKKVAKGGAFILASQILAMFFGFLRQFAVIRLLPPNDYGLFSLGMTVMGVCIILSGLGLPAGAQRYIGFFMGKEDELSARGVIISTIRILSISAASFTISILVSARPLAILFKKPEMTSVILKLAPLITLSLCIDIISSFYMGFHRVEVNVFFRNIGLYLVSLISVVLGLILRRDLSSVLWAVVLSYLLIAFFELLYSSRKFPIPLRCKSTSRMGKEILFFSLPLFGVSALNYLILQTDTLMLGHFSAAETVGLYNAAFQLLQILAVFLTSASFIFMPVASGLVATSNNMELKQLYRSTTKWLFIFTLPLFLVLFLFPSDILRLVFGGIYPRAALALKLLCLGEFVNTFLGPNDSTLLAYGRSKVLMVTAALSAVMNIFLNALFIPRWGMNGAAIASFVSLALKNILNSGYLYLRYKIHPFDSKYLKPVLLLILFSSILYFPLSYLLRFSEWFLLTYYPLFLAIGIASVLLSKSVEPLDHVLIKLIKRTKMPQ